MQPRVLYLSSDDRLAAPVSPFSIATDANYYAIPFAGDSCSDEQDYSTLGPDRQQYVTVTTVGNGRYEYATVPTAHYEIPVSHAGKRASQVGLGNDSTTTMYANPLFSGPREPIPPVVRHIVVKNPPFRRRLACVGLVLGLALLAALGLGLGIGLGGRGAGSSAVVGENSLTSTVVAPNFTPLSTLSTPALTTPSTTVFETLSSLTLSVSKQSTITVTTPTTTTLTTTTTPTTLTTSTTPALIASTPKTSTMPSTSTLITTASTTATTPTSTTSTTTSTTSTVLQTCTGDAVITTEEICNCLDFLQTCSQIVGNVVIAGDFITSNRLQTLFKNTRTITGKLIITNTTLLVDVSAFSQLQTLGNSLFVYNNTALVSLAGLGSLQSVYAITISRNLLLTIVPNFNQVTGVIASLEIAHNTALEVVSGFNGITGATSLVLIVSNPVLHTFTGFAGLLQTNADVLIDNNPMLATYSAFLNLQTVLGKISFLRNHAVAELGQNFFPGLRFVNGLVIFKNDALEAFSNLALSSINGSLYINNNTLLATVEFTSLSTVIGEAQVSFNPKLSSLDGFNALSTVTGTLSVLQNRDLTNMNFLKLNKVGGDVFIKKNPALSVISGFNKLDTIYGILYMDSNVNLQLVTGFTKLGAVGGAIMIIEHPQLTQINGLAALVAVFGLQPISDAYSIVFLNNPLLSTPAGVFFTWADSCFGQISVAQQYPSSNHGYFCGGSVPASFCNNFLSTSLLNTLPYCQIV